MFFLSLAPFVRAAKFGFLQGHSGANRRKSAVPPARVAQAAPARAVVAYLQLPEPDRQAMLDAGASMLHSARRANRSLSMLVMQLQDLPELELVFGCDAAEEAIDEVMTQLLDLAARKGLAARTARDTFTLLMPNLRVEAMVSAIQAKLGKPCCIDFELDGQEILLTTELMVRTVGPTESVEDVYEDLCKAIAKARLDQQPCRRPRRAEPDSRTSNMDPPPLAKPQKHLPTIHPPQPATMPMPMRSR